MSEVPDILHEEDVRKVIANQVAIGGTFFDSDPRGRSTSGQIYAPTAITSGHMVLQITGPDLTTYDVTLQAADMLNFELAQSAIDAVLPVTGLLTLYPSNANGVNPNDGQISFYASADWAETSGVSLIVTESTFDVGVLGDDVGSWIQSEGASPLNDSSRFGVYDDKIFYKDDNDDWWALGRGIESLNQNGFSITSNENGPFRQSVSMVPGWQTITISAQNNVNGNSVLTYWYASDGVPSFQVNTNGPDVGNGSICLCAGSVDPSTGSGISAMAGTLYARSMEDGSVELWFKNNQGPTDWVKIVPSA